MGTEPEEIEESPETVEEPQETGDTQDLQEDHTPETIEEPPDVDALLTQLEKVKDKIPPERLVFLNPEMQRGFSRKLNLLNRSAENSVRQIAEDAGIKLPEGKTALDLLTDGDGKEFFKLLRGQVSAEFKPVIDQVNAARQSQTITEMVNVARQNFPEVEKNLQDVIRQIDSDPELTKLSQAFDGAALPYVMRGVGTAIELNKANQKIAELQKLIDANKIVKKGGTKTSLAGGTKISEMDTKPPKGVGRLAWAVSRAAERVDSEEAQ